MLRLLLLALLLSLPLPGAAQIAPPAPLVSLPFDLVGGVIVLRNLSFNSRRGDFILDTGCTYALVVEQAAFPGQLHPSAKQGLGAAGAMPLYELPVTQFGFGAVPMPALANATSLATIRAVIGPRLLGLIGTGVLRHYEVVVDYAHRRLSCYALGPSQPAARPFTRGDSVRFTLEKGWPIAIGYIDSVPVQLLLDTGARTNFLDADFARGLRAGARPTGGQRETVIGLGGHMAAQQARLPALQVGTTEWRGVPVIVAPPVRYHSGRALPYQGILGGSFLSQEGLVSFHFGRGQFYFLRPIQP